MAPNEITRLAQHWENAESGWASGDFDRSRDAVSSMIADYPESPDPRIAAAIQVLHEETGRAEGGVSTRVESLVAEAVSLAPRDPYVLLPAAMLMLDIGNIPAAGKYVIALRDHVAEIREPEAHAALAHVVGKLALSQGKFALAEEQLRVAAQLDPTEPEYVNAVRRHSRNRMDKRITETGWRARNFLALSATRSRLRFK